MALNIIFGFLSELQVIKYTLAKTDRYIKAGYKYNLPKNVNEFSSLTDITNSLKNEYLESHYEKASEDLNLEYSKIEEKLLNLVKKIFIKTPPIFDVILTKYGIGGSYNPPNKIIINIANTSQSPIKTLIHEICHLMIEPFVILYNINQSRKERVVDLILNSEEFKVLQFDSWQGNYNGAEKIVDELFSKEFFASPEQFFKNLSKIK